MERFGSSIALVMAALVAGFSAGCSAWVERGERLGPPEAADPGPLLEFGAPRAGTVFREIDDVDLSREGLQILVRVFLNDVENGVWLDTLMLQTPLGALSPARVERGWDGRRQAVFPRVTLRTDAEGNPNILTAVGIRGAPWGRAQVEILGVAAPVMPTGCTETSLWEGDLHPGEKGLEGVPRGHCLVVQGDLLIDATRYADVATLHSVIEVRGDVIVSYNHLLSSLGGLHSLLRIAGDLRIVGNDLLPTAEEAITLRDRIGIESIGGVVEIRGNGPD